MKKPIPRKRATAKKPEVIEPVAPHSPPYSYTDDPGEPPAKQPTGGASYIIYYLIGFAAILAFGLAWQYL